MAYHPAFCERPRPVSVLLIVVLLAGLLPLTSCEEDSEKGQLYTNSGGILVAVVTAFALTAAQLAGQRPEPAPVGGNEQGGVFAAGTLATSAVHRPRRVLFPFPHSPRPPMGVTEVVSGVFADLRPTGGEDDLSIRTLARALGGSFLDAAIDQAVAERPQILSRIPNGVRVDYGSSFVDQTGTVISGSAEVTCSDIAASLSGVQATCGVTYDGYTVNGSATQVDWLEWGIDLDLGPGERVAGDLTVTGGTWPETTKPKPATVSGAAHFDTAICAAYPISGSVQVTIGGETTTVTFTDACDGTYSLDLPGANYWALTMNLYGCSLGYSAEISFVEENGVLTVDRGIAPANQGTFGSGRWTAGGWINDAEVRIEFSAPANPEHWNPNLTPGVSGTFFGRKLGLLNSYAGDLTYTISEVPPAVEEACSVTRTKVKDGHNHLYSCRGEHCR